MVGVPFNCSQLVRNGSFTRDDLARVIDDADKWLNIPVGRIKAVKFIVSVGDWEFMLDDPIDVPGYNIRLWPLLCYYAPSDDSEPEAL